MSKILSLLDLLFIKRKGVVQALGRNGFLNWIPDKIYLKLIYKDVFGLDFDFHSPVTFNEKLQWLKVNWYSEDACRCADKVYVRKFVKSRGYDYILNDLLGIYTDPNEIDFAQLPDKFVLKIANGSNRVKIVHNKHKFDITNHFNDLKSWLKINYFSGNREWVYKDLKPRIIAEKFLEDNDGALLDYKFLCFDGHIAFIIVDIDRFGKHRRNIYDSDWNLQALSIKIPNDPEKFISKPSNLTDMLEIANKLSRGFPHVRVDLYNVDGKIYFGEMTFFHGGGFEKFSDDNYNIMLGNLLKLPS